MKFGSQIDAIQSSSGDAVVAIRETGGINANMRQSLGAMSVAEPGQRLTSQQPLVVAPGLEFSCEVRCSGCAGRGWSDRTAA